MENDPRTPLETGKQIALGHFGEVTIGELIGRGGSCLAYLATYEDSEQKRILAVKEFYETSSVFAIYKLSCQYLNFRYSHLCPE